MGLNQHFSAVEFAGENRVLWPYLSQFPNAHIGE
jgi:hypothetical protein